MTEPRYPSRCIERFLDYVCIDTQSREGSETYPSTETQWVLLRKLVDELKALGVEDAEIDDYGYVFGTIPATTDKSDVPTIGFLAHVDTSPEMSGAGVRPVQHENYDGRDLVLPDDPSIVIREADNPALVEQRGATIITASGTTLLGADNKAGVAEIMGAVEVLMRERDIPHGPVRVGFTPDEEIGQGTRYFDVERFGALCAYTMDGETRGELQDETFSADGFTITFHGVNQHPGFAKGRMVNALKVAGRFLANLPLDARAPEATEQREGFVHAYRIEGGVEACQVHGILRDFDADGLAGHAAWLRERVDEAVAAVPGSSADVEIREQYRNMKEVLDRHPEVVAHAEEAYRRAGLAPRRVPVRGGTDGAQLCFKGLPTPNLFAGEHNFHGKQEWVSTADMHKAVEVIVELARVWEERS